MSLFSSAQQSSPADHAHELLLDYMSLLHNALSWRADSLRSLAESLEGLREDLENGLDGVAAVLARWIGEDQPEERHELGADDHGESC